MATGLPERKQGHFLLPRPTEASKETARESSPSATAMMVLAAAVEAVADLAAREEQLEPPLVLSLARVPAAGSPEEVVALVVLVAEGVVAALAQSRHSPTTICCPGLVS